MGTFNYTKDIKGKSSYELHEFLNSLIIDGGGSVSKEFLLSEIRRVEQYEQNELNIQQAKKMKGWTIAVGVMTIIILFATVINLLIAFKVLQ